MLLWFSICGMAPAVMVVLLHLQQQQKRGNSCFKKLCRNVHRVKELTLLCPSLTQLQKCVKAPGERLTEVELEH